MLGIIWGQAKVAENMQKPGDLRPSNLQKSWKREVAAIP